MSRDNFTSSARQDEDPHKKLFKEFQILTYAIPSVVFVALCLTYFFLSPVAPSENSQAENSQAENSHEKSTHEKLHSRHLSETAQSRSNDSLFVKNSKPREKVQHSVLMTKCESNVHKTTECHKYIAALRECRSVMSDVDNLEITNSRHNDSIECIEVPKSANKALESLRKTAPSAISKLEDKSNCTCSVNKILSDQAFNRNPTDRALVEVAKLVDVIKEEDQCAHLQKTIRTLTAEKLLAEVGKRRALRKNSDVKTLKQKQKYSFDPGVFEEIEKNGAFSCESKPNSEKPR